MMEKGSFHTSQSNLQTDDIVNKVALPNQLPKGLDFSELPLEHLRSAALESLINQNEDLMARLSVNIRRGSEYEAQVQSLERENSTLKQRFEAMKEQYLVIQEKDRVSTAKLLQSHEEAQHQKKQAQKLEALYADLYVQAQAFQNRLQKSERHLARVRKAAKAVQKQAKQARHLFHELDQSAVQHAQAVQSFEVKLISARTEVENLRNKALERDRIYEEKTRAENQLIFEQRQSEQSKAAMQQLIDNMQNETKALRVQLKEVLVENEGYKSELERQSAELPHLRDQRQALTEQVESLQALWNHKQKENEALDEKNRALQKLNQTISVTLNQQRREIHQLKSEMEQERFASNEKIKTLISEVQMLRRQIVEDPDTDIKL